MMRLGRRICPLLFLFLVVGWSTTKIRAAAAPPAGSRSYDNLPFVLGVRDSFMIAHSFHNHPQFGPAGGLHGATYTCDVEFSSATLVQETNWVIDIGRASEILRAVLQRYDLKNLDDIFVPDGDSAPPVLTTTEFVAKRIHSDLCQRLRSECPDFDGNLCVKLWESHKAWASYTGKVAAATTKKK